MLEGYATLGFLGGLTEDQLGTLVTGGLSPPGVLVKTVTTLDVLSGGRAILGIGARLDYERRARGLGVPFPPLAERFERLEETLQIAHQMWNGDDGPFEGTHYSWRGRSTRRSRSAAAPADHDRRQRRAEDPAPGGPVRRRLQPVRAPADEVARTSWTCSRALRAVGRDYDAIEKTVASNVDFGEDPKAGAAALLAHLRELAAAGIDHALVSPRQDLGRGHL